MKKEWFVEWFDSPYYHTLYQQHDDSDARLAIDNLLKAVDLQPGARVLDLACGKGRHARYLADKGYDVTGLDISESSIAFARQFEHDRLAFYQHDMRLPFRSNYFDAVMNMFTSFGYFANDRDHIRALQNMQKELKPGGLLVLDFFNSYYVKAHLVARDHQEIDGIQFDLRKSVRGGFVYKSVEFDNKGRKFEYRERVRLFTLADFEQMFAAVGLQLKACYGGYDLSPYDTKTSKRLILIAAKPAKV